MFQFLPQASELPNEKYLNFVKERLVEREKSIFEPMSKSNIKTNNKAKKPRKKNYNSERGQTDIWCYCGKTN